MSQQPPMGERQPFDISGHVRRARRLGDLSQRDLSARAGVPQATVARVERGDDIRVRVFVRMLEAAGLRLAVVDGNGAIVDPMPRDVFHDRAGRRLPAHLDVHAAPETPTMRMLLHDCSPVDVGEAWHHKRAERDRLRAEAGNDSTVDQLTMGVARERLLSRRHGGPARPHDDRARAPGARARSVDR